MPRGLVYRSYTADNGDVFQTLVDADHAADTNRGWGAVVPGGTMIPRGLSERVCEGMSAVSGRRGTCRIGSAAALLWQGVATTFMVEADDGTLDTMTVTRRRGERRRVPHA